MNPLMQRYATPAVVLGIATYLGWPGSTPTDYGSDVVRAKAVRWRANDLDHPPTVRATIDPFREVLVATEETVVEPETGKLVAPTKPTGPSASEIESGLRVDGIALMGGRKWAVINGRPRLPGDQVKTDDANRYRCEILSVGTNQVVVVCLETTVTLRPRRHESTSVAAQEQTTASEQVTVQPLSNQAPPPAGA